MSEQTKEHKPGIRAGLKSESGYFNCNIFAGAQKTQSGEQAPAISIAVNAPNGNAAFTNLTPKTSADGRPYLSGVATIGDAKYLVKIDQIKKDEFNFLTLGMSVIGGPADKPTFTPVSQKGASLYPNDKAKGSNLEAMFRDTFKDLPADAFDYHPRDSASAEKVTQSQPAQSAQPDPVSSDMGDLEEEFLGPTL